MTAVSKLSSKVKRNGGFTGSLVLMQKITLLRANEKRKLDDGWPESIEEQSLLLLVWKDYIRRQYVKDV